MNSQNPNSPEDRLLDELLREQAHGADEAFLRQIEGAIDAGPPQIVKSPPVRRYGRLAIAAGIGLVAGIPFFLQWESRNSGKEAIAARARDAVAERQKVDLAMQELNKAVRDQEDKVEERRKALETIAVRTASGKNVDVLPPLIGKLMYVKDESLAWVIIPRYGSSGKFPFKYVDSNQGANNTGGNLVGLGQVIFTEGVMKNRFKLLGSDVRRESNSKINVEVDVTIVRVEDQRPNKKGVVYEFPSPMNEQRKNEFLKYDRTAVFSLEVTGMEGKEFKVEENTTFSLPPGGEKKDYLLKSITPAGVVVEMVDGGQVVEIRRGAMPAGEALAALAGNAAGSPQGNIREDAIKRGLDAQGYSEVEWQYKADLEHLTALKLKQVALDDALDNTPASALVAMAESIASRDSAQTRPMLPPLPSPTLRQVPPTAAMFSLDSPAKSLSEQPTGDQYGTFIEQPWKSPAQDPLSTFSIDVDTASYGNVRRMIREGREIPKDAVRIEECINAFRYSYAQPQGEAPFAVGATLAVCPWAPDHQLVRVAIKGREIEKNKRPASNLVFLIDVSGSMQSPDKLPLLKQSMLTLVDQLDERDRVAIVVYAGTEGVALPSTRLDADGRAAVTKALANLEAGGSTNGGAGINRAYELAMAQKIEGGVNRVILATDGDFNVGVTGRESLVDLVKSRAQGGVYLTVAGFGTGNLNDAMMDAITRDGNGNYFYIDSEREGKKVFLQNLSGTLVTIAKDVKIQVEFNPAKVGGYRLIGYANRVLRNEDFNNDKVDAGDIGAGHTVTAFYELSAPGSTATTDPLKYQATTEKPAAVTPAAEEWLTVKLRYKHPDGDESRKIEFPLNGTPASADKTDVDFQFATAAALFGMKLRGMDEVREVSWKKVLELARPGLADDPTEDRAEFAGLVENLVRSGDHAVPPPADVIRDHR